MKAPDTHGAGDRRGDDVRTLKRTPRRTHSGTIGFGQVFSLVKGGKHGSKGERGHGRDENGILIDGGSAGAQPVPAGLLFQHALETGSVLDQAANGVNNTAGNAQAAQIEAQQINGGKVTPARANALIEDVVREMRGEHEARELHLELDPAHLGPIVVKLVLKHGKLAASVITRDAEAAIELDARTDELHARLSKLGFAQVDVAVTQDSEAFAPTTWAPGGSL